MPSAFDLPPGFFDEQQGWRDLRIDGHLHRLIFQSKEHGTRCGRMEPSNATSLGINIVLRGRGRCEDAAGGAHELVPGVLFHRHRSLVRATWFDPGSDYAECYLVIDAGTGLALVAAGLLSRAPVVNIGVDAVIVDGFRHLSARARLSESLAPGRALLLESVAWVNDLYDRARRNRVLDPWDKAIEDACLLLEHNFEARERTAEVAAQLGVSYAAFRKRFKEATGHAPADYRIRRRLESAQHHLLGGSVAATARLLGYNDPYTFSTQFKKFVGVSPREFRRRQRQRGRLVLVPLTRRGPPVA
jgi:AraC-like DNA-binding protein